MRCGRRACFNLTLEILFVDRDWGFTHGDTRRTVSISLLRFFSLIVNCHCIVDLGSGTVSISLLRFFSLIARHRKTFQPYHGSFNLTLEILFVDRFGLSALPHCCLRVSISLLRFFSLIVASIVDMSHFGFVSISLLRFFSLIEHPFEIQ